VEGRLPDILEIVKALVTPLPLIGISKGKTRAYLKSPTVVWKTVNKSDNTPFNTYWELSDLFAVFIA